MELSLIQCVLIGVWTGICLTGMLTGTYLTRCLVMAAGVGVILGDLETGLMMGAVGELAFLGFGVSSGGSVPPNPIGPGIIGAIIAITMKESGVDVDAALAYSFPFAVLIQFLITGIYTFSTGLVAKAEEAVEKGHYKRFRLMANSTIILFICVGFLIGFVAAFQVESLEKLINLIPDWVTAGLGTAGKILPAVGFAVILTVMVSRETVPFLFLGYVSAAYLGMPVIGIALVAAAFALMDFFRDMRGSAVSELQDQNQQNQMSRGNLKENIKMETGVCRLSEANLRRLSRKTAFRAYFLQNGYNYGNYEGLSYANIMFPALRKLYPEDKDFRQALKDSISYCSVNPNFLPILTSIHLVTLNRGLSTKDTRDIRLALMGPLAGIGDSLVQFCIAPVFSTIGASMAQEGLIAGPLVFLLGMNLLLAGLKSFSESLGYRLGTSLTEKLKDSLGPVSRTARMVGVAVISGLVVTNVDIQTEIAFGSQGTNVFALQSFLDTLLPGALPVLYTAFMYYLIRQKGWSMYRLVGLTLVLGIGLNFIGVLA